MNLSILIHTFDAYKHLWPGCWQSWQPVIKNEPANFYWGTDIDLNTPEIPGFKVLFSGPGEWSDRLRALLKQIPTEYVLYAQEDHWLTKSPPNLDELMAIVQKNNIFRLQIAPITHFYKVFSHENTTYFDVSSKYLVSHQPSIWRKSFLLDCLKPGETPWVNEYKGTLRLQQTGQMRASVEKKIAIYPHDWFSHKCVKGVVQGMQ